MRKGMATVALAAGLVIGAGGFTAAHAESFWHAFGGVRIGGIHFTMGYHSPPRHRRYPGRYYRTKHQLKHRGYKCGRLCYRRGGYYNHHESCGLLGAHMSYHGYPVPYYPQYERGYRYYDDDYYDDDRYYDRGRHRQRHDRRHRHRLWWRWR